MFELDETQRLVESAVRAWCAQNLAPAVPALEAGSCSLFDGIENQKVGAGADSDFRAASFGPPWSSV
jgi:hypothetical protein